MKMNRVLYFLFATFVAMVNYKIYASVFYAIVSFFLAPLSLVIMLFKQTLTLSVIESTFEFFFK